MKWFDEWFKRKIDADFGLGQRFSGRQKSSETNQDFVDFEARDFFQNRAQYCRTLAEKYRLTHEPLKDGRELAYRFLLEEAATEDLKAHGFIKPNEKTRIK